jgi:hypothetical protein
MKSWVALEKKVEEYEKNVFLFNIFNLRLRCIHLNKNKNTL